MKGMNEDLPTWKSTSIHTPTLDSQVFDKGLLCYWVCCVGLFGWLRRKQCLVEMFVQTMGHFRFALHGPPASSNLEVPTHYVHPVNDLNNQLQSRKHVIYIYSLTLDHTYMIQ